MKVKELKSWIIILYNYSKVLEALTDIERVCLKSINFRYEILEIINKTKEELQLIK